MEQTSGETVLNKVTLVTPEKVKSMSVFNSNPATCTPEEAYNTINPLFFQRLDEMSSWELIDEPELYMSFVDTKDLPALRAIDVSRLTLRQEVRVELVVHMLQDRLDGHPLYDPNTAIELYHSQITEEDFTVNVNPDEVKVFRRDIPISAFAKVVCAIPTTPSPYPAPESKARNKSVAWSLGEPGPSSSRPNKTVRSPPESSLNDKVECPILDIDNRKTLKKIAAYRLRTETKTPKEDRDRLRQAARDMRNRRKDIYGFSYGRYEAQMLGLGVKLTHAVNADMKDMVQTIVNEFRSAVDKGSESTDILAQAIKNTGESIKSGAKDATSTMSSTLDSGVNAMTRTIWSVALVVIAYFAISKTPLSNRSQVLLLSTLALAAVLPADLWTQIKHYFPTGKENTAYEAQMDLCPSTLAHLLTLTLSFMTIGKKDPMQVTKDFMKTIPTYSRTVNGWRDLSSFIIGLVESFINFIRVRFGADRIMLYKSSIQEVNAWCSRVMDLMNDAQTGTNVFTPERLQLLVALRNQGKDLTDMARLDATVAPMLHKYLGYLDHICTMCAAALHTVKGGRVPPVVLGVTGAPGVGKSELIQFMYAKICSALLPYEEAEKLKFNYAGQVFQKGSSEYWNGYCGQPVVVMDDFGQAVVVPGEENDYMSLIRMANSWPMPLNFADLENKGKNFFTSQAIILTTNLDNIDKCQSVINEPGAVTRRIDFGYKLTLAKGWDINGKLDYYRYKKILLEENRLPTEAWVFRKHVFGIGSAAKTDMTRTYTFDEVMSEVTTHIKRSKAGFTETTEFLARFAEGCYETQMDLPKEIPEDVRERWYYGSNVHKQCLHGLSQVPSRLGSFWDGLKSSPWHGIKAQQVTGAGVQAELARILLDMTDWTSPLVKFIVSWTQWSLIFAALGYFISSISKYFKPKQHDNDKLKSALLKKEAIPEEITAQMLNFFRPADFQTVIERDGQYTTALTFSPEVLKRAYERHTGKTLTQSNEPESARFVQRRIVGNHVMEANHVAQIDWYARDIADVAFQNLYRMRVEDQEEEIECDVGHLLLCGNHTAIMPYHFTRELITFQAEGRFSKTARVIFRSCADNQRVFSYPLDEFLGFQMATREAADVTMIQLTRSVCAGKSLKKFFITEREITDLRNIKICLETIDGPKCNIRRSRHVSAWRKDGTCYEGPSQYFTVAKGYEYLAYTEKGDCGGLAILEENESKQCRRLLGIHVAGQPSMGKGITNILTQEAIESMTLELGGGEDKFVQSQMGLPCKKAPIEGSFTSLNVAAKAHNMNPKSCIVKTPLFNRWGECTKGPVSLKPFKGPEGMIYPMKQALEPYATPTISFDATDVARAVKHAMAPFRKATINKHRRIYTFEEAVRGIPGVFNGIPRGTSPGYPWVLQGHVCKKVFFGTGQDYEFTSPECQALKASVLQIIEDAKKGIRNPFIWIDFGKDEVRSAEKVLKGAMRLISSAPLEYVIAFRMYFLSFTESVQETRVENGVALGINVYTEWDYLSQEMQQKGPHCVAGDFKGFDSSEQPDVHWGILDGINDWYDDSAENRRVRSTLWMEVTHSRHLGGLEGKADTVYQWNKSLPSGHPATTVINSFYNLTMFNMVWTDIMGLQYASRFWEYNYACVYGDDNILNIHPEVINKFNQNTISAGMAKRGLTYTAEDKSDLTTPYRTLWDISFLKRKFRKETILNKVVAPQDLDSILYIPYWCKNKSKMESIVKGNLEITYIELSLHDPAVWDQYAAKIHEQAVSVMGLPSEQLFQRKEYMLLSQTSDMIWPL